MLVSRSNFYNVLYLAYLFIYIDSICLSLRCVSVRRDRPGWRPQSPHVYYVWYEYHRGYSLCVKLDHYTRYTTVPDGIYIVPSYTSTRIYSRTYCIIILVTRSIYNYYRIYLVYTGIYSVPTKYLVYTRINTAGVHGTGTN